nr:MAG TPA: hypothetical protein [Caudoviricetes sp.]DAO52223.1 MAG TPA: hypothetical protein [Caudoviricetes sp.]
MRLIKDRYEKSIFYFFKIQSFTINFKPFYFSINVIICLDFKP